MTPVALGDSVWLHFGTSSASTGAATNADSTPTVTVAEDGTDMGFSPTVTNVTTGLYKVQIDATAGNGFEAGKRYSAYVVATVGGIAGRDGLGEFEVLAVDLNTGVASVSGLTAANLDVAVSTRMASYTQPTGFLAATFPVLVASTTNITAGTITTVTTLTNLPAITANWLTAAGIDADAFTAAKFAADVTTEFQTGLATSAALATVQADTDDIQTRLPAALVGGRMDSSVGAMAANTMTAAAAAADFGAEIAASVITVAMTESYAALGVAPTPAQIWFEIRALLAEKAVAATTLTAKKLDGATTAATYTLSDATNPTSITRAS